MKLNHLVLTFCLSLLAIPAGAASGAGPTGDENGNPASSILPIKDGTKAMEVAELANRIWEVKVLRTPKAVYKVVVLDSELSGDLTSTIIVLTAESEVGGAAGFESAFQVGPTFLGRLNSAKIVKGRLELTGVKDVSDPTPQRLVLEYNPRAHDLAVVTK